MSSMKNYIKLASAMALCGSSFVVGKFLIMSMPLLGICTLRFTAAVAFLIPWVLIKEGRMPKVSHKDLLQLFLQAFWGIFLFNVLLLNGLKLTSAIVSGIIAGTDPAIIAGLSWLFFKEVMNSKKIAGIFLAVAGIIAINIASVDFNTIETTSSMAGNLMVLGATVCEAVFTIFSKKVSENLTPLAATTYLSIFGLLIFFPLALYQGDLSGLANMSIIDILVIIYYGVAVTALAFILWYSGVSRVPTSTAGIFTGVMPASVLLLSYIFLDEKFAWLHFVGFSCVLAGIILASLQEDDCVQAKRTLTTISTKK